jgi:SAM-dependent methyltransferase
LESLDVIQEISPRDDMYRGYPEHYFSLGRDAVRSLRIAMRVARKGEVSSVLDCPSGHGRVLRTLKAAFPDAELTACDIDRDAVAFCAQTFGATPVYAATRPEDIRFEREFDLIWSGSLLTHLEAERFMGFLRLFESCLAPGGLMVFTTNGPHTHRMLRSLLETSPPQTETERVAREQAELYFPVPKGAFEKMAADYERDGFTYADYDFMENFGATLSSPAWVCKRLEQLPGLRLINYTEQGWDMVQDVVACVRRG